jgi:hypothetical protein
MKKSLFLYLFIISALINVFTFTFYSNQEKMLTKQLSGTTKKYKDSLALLTNQLDDANYFSFERNSNAQDYFAVTAPISIPSEKLSTFVIEQLMAYNEKPEGNTYTGQTQLSEKKFIINKAKVLNHRWIIADYSDGTYWGEVFLKYFVNPDQTVSFEVMSSILHQK